MKKQRILYMVGIMGTVLMAMGIMFLKLFPIQANDQMVLASVNQPIIEEDWLTAVSEHVKAAEYMISSVNDVGPQQIAYQAPNRAQNLRTYFSDTGIQVEPRLIQGEGWNLSLDIVGLGNGLQSIVPDLERITTAGNRVTMDYGQWQSWYVNDVRGIEQGFTIDEPLFPNETGLIQIDMAVSGDLVPHFISEDAVGLVTAVGEQVLTYQDLIVFDAQGKELAAEMAVVDLDNGQSGIRLAVDVAEADYPIVVDPLLGGGIDWIGWINQPDANYGFSVSTAGDVNFDGFDDVLVGANWFDGGAPDTGAVFGYYGGPAGLLLVHQWMVVGNMPGMELGYDVSPAGDVNADNFADVIIGTHMTPTGRALVFTGTPAGLSQQPLWVASGEQGGDGFGTAVNMAGDVNNDNVDDIIVGAPYYDGAAGVDSGRAYVFHGPLTSTVQPPDWIGEGGEVAFIPGGMFGYSVSTAGDVNQDSFDDVIIGEPLAEGDGITGLAVIFGGSPTGLFMPGSGEPARSSDGDWISNGPYVDGARFGAAVSYAGDVNGDTFADVVVGAPLYDSFGSIPAAGGVYVFTGTNSFSNMSSFPDPNWTFELGIPNAMLGHSVGTAGDVDQDGYDDIIAGAPQFDNEAIGPQQTDAVNGGGAFVLRGSPIGLTDIWEFSSNVANAKLGTSVGTAGDVNADGYADIIIGAPSMPNPMNGLGEAYSLYGSGEIRNLQAFNDSPTPLGGLTTLWTEMDAGGVLSYEWELGNGALFNGPVVKYVYPQPGIYTAVVTGTSFTDQMTATTAVTISASSLITPGGGSLEFINGDTGFGTGVKVPPGAVSDTLSLFYTPLMTVPQRPPVNAIGYYFDLDVDDPPYQVFLPIIVNGDTGANIQGLETAVANSMAGSNAVASYYFAIPITVTTYYTDTNLTEAEELSLYLPYWNEELQEWIDIAQECGLEDTYAHYPELNYFTVQVCHLSQFGVAH